jgi:hypothetical protein
MIEEMAQELNIPNETLHMGWQLQRQEALKVLGLTEEALAWLKAPRTLDTSNIPNNQIEAQTPEGKSYIKLANTLETFAKRRMDVIKEFEEKTKALAAPIEELIRCHQVIDILVKSMAGKAIPAEFENLTNNETESNR